MPMASAPDAQAVVTVRLGPEPPTSARTSAALPSRVSTSAVTSSDVAAALEGTELDDENELPPPPAGDDWRDMPFERGDTDSNNYNEWWS